MGATTAAFRLVDAVAAAAAAGRRARSASSFAITSFVDAQGRVDYYDNFDYPTYRRYVDAGR